MDIGCVRDAFECFTQTLQGANVPFDYNQESLELYVEIGCYENVINEIINPIISCFTSNNTTNEDIYGSFQNSTRLTMEQYEVLMIPNVQRLLICFPRLSTDLETVLCLLQFSVNRVQIPAFLIETICRFGISNYVPFYQLIEIDVYNQSISLSLNNNEKTNQINYPEHIRDMLYELSYSLCNINDCNDNLFGRSVDDIMNDLESIQNFDGFSDPEDLGIYSLNNDDITNLRTFLTQLDEYYRQQIDGVGFSLLSQLCLSRLNQLQTYINDCGETVLDVDEYITTFHHNNDIREILEYICLFPPCYGSQ